MRVAETCNLPARSLEGWHICSQSDRRGRGVSYNQVEEVEMQKHSGGDIGCDTGRLSSVQFSLSVVSDSLWPMNHSTPGLLAHHQLQESTQTHVHRVNDAIQPSHPLLSPSSPALNLSQHQGLFKWVSSSHQVAKILEFQLQHQSFQWNTQDWSPLGWTGWISLQSKGLSGVFSNTTVWSQAILELGDLEANVSVVQTTLPFET